MDPFSILTGPETKAIRIPVDLSWKDHHFMGRPVFPAVAAMALMGDALSGWFPQHCIHTLLDARFPKFLEILPDTAFIDAALHLIPHPENSTVEIRLTTSRTPGAAGIRRSFTHAQMQFEASPPLPRLIPIAPDKTLSGICTVIDPQRLYEELVPFGPAFRSVRHLVISPDGALAQVQSPVGSGPPSKTLGAGFPLDGAFHGACVWGQRYLGQVLFPVSIAKRVISTPVRNDELYVARMVPVSAEAGNLVADIRILDQAGNMREMAFGVVMRDVSRGTMKPPAWIGESES